MIDDRYQVEDLLKDLLEFIDKNPNGQGFVVGSMNEEDQDTYAITGTDWSAEDETLLLIHANEDLHDLQTGQIALHNPTHYVKKINVLLEALQRSNRQFNRGRYMAALNKDGFIELAETDPTRKLTFRVSTNEEARDPIADIAKMKRILLEKNGDDANGN